MYVFFSGSFFKTVYPLPKLRDMYTALQIHETYTQGGRAQLDFSLAWLEAAWYFSEGGHSTTQN